MFRIIPIKRLVVGLFALLMPPGLSAQEMRSHSILVLDQSDLRGPFYYQLSAGLRGVLTADAEARVTIFGENLDLTRFGGAGGIGGYVLLPSEIGADAARLALRVLDGERGGDVPPVTREAKPIFNSNQM